MEAFNDLPFTLVDLAVVLLILISGLLALYRGFVTEVLAVAGWIGAAVVTLVFFSDVQPLARELIPYTLAADVVAALALFLGSLLVFSLVLRLIARAVRGQQTNWFDRILGFFFGLARGLVLLAIVYLLLAEVVPPAEQPRMIREARTLPLVAATGEALLRLLPESLALPGEPAEQRGEAAPPRRTVAAADLTGSSLYKGPARAPSPGHRFAMSTLSRALSLTKRGEGRRHRAKRGADGMRVRTLR